MAIDTHDDETAARALITAAEADTSPAAQRLRGVRRLTAYIAIVYVAAAPIFFGVSLWRFGQALLDGNWISFWFAAIGVVPLFLPSLFWLFMIHSQIIHSQIIHSQIATQDSPIDVSMTLSHQATKLLHRFCRSRKPPMQPL